MSAPQDTSTARAEAARLGAWGAWGTLLGVLVSGPLAVLWVQAAHPQPAWQGPEAFVGHYHPQQAVPYVGGILLVAGVLLLFASLHALAPERWRVPANLGLCFGSCFATLIFLNYALQTTYVPALVRSFAPGDAPLVSAFSMSNPESLAWALEMWGWGFSGLATCAGLALRRRARAGLSGRGQQVGAQSAGQSGLTW